MQIILIISLIFITVISKADKMFLDNFKLIGKWDFITDQVMGGVSYGKVEYQKINNQTTAIITGKVSLENNGGFIQIRRNLNKIDLSGSKKVKIISKGNNEKYYIHLRTSMTILPWQYYQSSFMAGDKFGISFLPIEGFKRSSFLLPSKINPKNIKSIGIVAYGKNYDVNLLVKEIGFIN